MIATNEEEKKIIWDKIIPNAKANDVLVEWLEKDEIKEKNPAVKDDVLGGLSIPGEFVCDPFKVTRAFAEQAVLNGAKVYLGSGVKHLDYYDKHFTITLENNKQIYSRYVINAAGVYSDEIARLIGDKSFTISPRKGQFILTEEAIDISQIILPVPTPKSKGKLISPIVFGGHLLGPTAEDHQDKEDRSTTEKGLSEIIDGCASLVPSVKDLFSIRQFAGVRAVCSENDFILRASSKNKKFINASGIRSTGLSASPGIAELIARELQKSGLKLRKKTKIIKELPQMYYEGNCEDADEVICLCRSVTKAGVLNALQSPIAPKTIDGVKRRSGAAFGKCQGNNCIPKLIDILEEHYGTEKPPMKGIQESYLYVGSDEQSDL